MGGLRVQDEQQGRRGGSASIGEGMRDEEGGEGSVVVCMRG